MPSRTRKTVPLRSPTYSHPSASNASPHATPRSDATCTGVPDSSMRYTAPSNRLETYSDPSGPYASEVALTIPETKGWRAPEGVTRNTETGDSWPRGPL